MRPKIEIDEPVWEVFRTAIAPKHFAGWSAEGRPMVWPEGLTSHTLGDGMMPRAVGRIKTKDGVIWP